MGFTGPGNPTAKPVTIRCPTGKTYTISVDSAAGDTAIQGRDKLAAAIDGHAIPNWRGERRATEAVLKIKDLPAGATVKFAPGDAGGVAETTTVGRLAVAAASFKGAFDPLDNAGHATLFCCRLHTGVGRSAGFDPAVTVTQGGVLVGGARAVPEPPTARPWSGTTTASATAAGTF